MLASAGLCWYILVYTGVHWFKLAYVGFVDLYWVMFFILAYVSLNGVILVYVG